MSLLQNLFGRKPKADSSLSFEDKVRYTRSLTKRIKLDEFTAGAYLRPNMIVLHGVCHTNSGGYNCEPYRSFETTLPDADLGTELLRVLQAASQTPIPENLKVEQQKVFQVCKVRSWSQLTDKSFSCSVTQTQKDFSFLPTRREGSGFHHLPDLTIRIDTSSTPEEVGKALRRGFQICQ